MVKKLLTKLIKEGIILLTSVVLSIAFEFVLRKA